MKVAVIEGGRSLERGVSLRTSGRVQDGLERLGHEVTAIEADGVMIESLRALKPAVAMIAVHGATGEDGTIQQLLELLEIPYTGSSPAASALASDKAFTKIVLRAAGLPTPESALIDGTSLRELGIGSLLPEIGERLGWPLIVKPVAQGSALGVSLARSESEVPAALLSALSYDSRALLESQVVGRELAIAVLEQDGGPTVLPVVEAVPVGDVYDFEARYEAGATRLVCPADLDSETTAKVMALAAEAFEALGCSGCARVDVILTSEGEASILEVDTVPGLTQTSLVPQAAEAAGIGFEALLEQLLTLALTRD